MSVAPEQIAYSGYPGPFASIEEVGLQEIGVEAATPLEHTLQNKKIAAIALSVVRTDFLDLSQRFSACIEDPEALEALRQTYLMVDRRYGHTAGYFRKEQKHDDAGIQIEDPKHVFQFNEQARSHWAQQFTEPPELLTAFLEKGSEIQDMLLQAAREAVAAIDQSHPGVLEEHFPANGSSVSFMRVVQYDGYDNPPNNTAMPVAKPHVDICSYTIQAWSSAPGFWGRNEDGKVFFDDDGENGLFFASKTHEKIFGKDSRIRPLVHGVDRISPDPEASTVPERTAVVLFVNPTTIDPGVTPAETKAAY